MKIRPLANLEKKYNSKTSLIKPKIIRSMTLDMAPPIIIDRAREAPGLFSKNFLQNNIIAAKKTKIRRYKKN